MEVLGVILMLPLAWLFFMFLGYKMSEFMDEDLGLGVKGIVLLVIAYPLFFLGLWLLLK